MTTQPTPLVNGIPTEPGCYVGSQHGQYAIDVAVQVLRYYGDIVLDDDPEALRHMIDMGDEDAADRLVDLWDDVVDRLNAITDGGFWSWEDGELFLIADCPTCGGGIGGTCAEPCECDLPDEDFGACGVRGCTECI